MERRQFLSGMGIGATISIFPSMASAASTCGTSIQTDIRIIDASKSLTKSAKQIADAGVTTVIRF